MHTYIYIMHSHVATYVDRSSKSKFCPFKLELTIQVFNNFYHTFTPLSTSHIRFVFPNFSPRSAHDHVGQSSYVHLQIPQELVYLCTIINESLASVVIITYNPCMYNQLIDSIVSKTRQVGPGCTLAIFQGWLYTNWWHPSDPNDLLGFSKISLEKLCFVVILLIGRHSYLGDKTVIKFVSSSTNTSENTVFSTLVLPWSR